MNQPPLHGFVLRRIEEVGRRLGAPTITFSGRKISIPGEDIYVANSLVRFITRTSGFYLPLPPNAFGVVIFPDGTSHNMEGGVHEAPPGLYKLQYVDKHERLDFTSPISEMTTDGEKLTLKVVLRYRVVDPIVALRIDKPAETLIEHIEADVAQYIRTHDHTEIADVADGRDSRLLAFFSERHKRRKPLSDAVELLGVELKEFSGDKEYVEIRRRRNTDDRQTELTRQQEGHQQEINRLKAQFKAENDRLSAALSADLNRQAAEQKAEIENIEARFKTEKDEILYKVRMQEIELEDRRQRWDRQREKFTKAFEAITQTIGSGYPLTPTAIQTMLELMKAINKESRYEEVPPSAHEEEAQNPPPVQPAPAAPPPAVPAVGGDKVERLTNILLDLLKSKK